MSYTKTEWVNGKAPAINADNLNKIEQGIYDCAEGKVDKVEGKALSTNDYTNAEKSKLAGIETGAQVNAPNTVIDANYVHTDNNYTTGEKTTLSTHGNILAECNTSEEGKYLAASKNFVNSSVATNTAYFKGTKDIVNDLHLTSTATHEQVAAKLGETITGTTNNDYAFVSYPAEGSVAGHYDRYKYTTSSSAWSFEYTLNNSSFTAAQWDSINSGVTSEKVGKLDGIEAGATKVGENTVIGWGFTKNQGTVTSILPTIGGVSVGTVVNNIVKVTASEYIQITNPDAHTIYFITNEHSVGDIAYWDGSNIAFTPYMSWQSSLGTALGVCFIPTSHAKAWGDGKARFLSVKGVTSTGAASDSEQSMEWGGYGTDTPLTNYTKVPTWSNTIGGSTGSNDYGYISSDKFTTGTQNVVDSLSKYNGSTPYIPSPYASDGSFYSDYMKTLEGNNALSDFNGKTNTSTIVATLGTGSNYAARACSLYSTSGLAAGEWYLPACGELAYIMPRFNVIQAALAACSGVSLGSSGRYWSSSEYSSGFAFRVFAFDGYVVWYYKDDNYRVRPVVSLA